jgi:hypothetical protein
MPALVLLSNESVDNISPLAAKELILELNFWKPSLEIF